jgi:hypothetical protein
MQQYNLLTYYSNLGLSKHYNREQNAILYKIVTKSLGEKYNSLREKTKHNKLQKNSTVWFSPFTEFPLYKFNDYISNNDANITRSKKLNNTVDTVILNSTMITKYYFPEYFGRSGVFHVIDKKTYNDKLKQSVKTIKDNNLNQDYVVISKPQVDNIHNSNKQTIEETPTVEGYLIGDEWGFAKAYQNIEIFEKIINDYEQGKINIVFDDQINNDVNGGLEFDLDLFSTLVDMIGSNDEGNINIAREIIANTNLELAKPYVLFLFQLYPFLSRQNNTRSWKYVVDQFKADKSKLCYDHLQMFLGQLGKLYPEYVPIVFKCMGIYFNKQWKNEVIKEIEVS